MLETALAKLLTLKVGATVLAATATGGVALAAANNALPNPLAGTKATPSAHPTAKHPGEKGKGSPSAAGKGSPSPSLVGLCRAYVAGAGDNPGKALENPAFRVLITTAGDKEKVAAWCDTLLAAEKKGRPDAAPSGRPSIAAPRPSGKPESRPTPAETHRTEAPVGGKPVAPTASTN